MIMGDQLISAAKEGEERGGAQRMLMQLTTKLESAATLVREYVIRNKLQNLPEKSKYIDK